MHLQNSSSHISSVNQGDAAKFAELILATSDGTNVSSWRPSVSPKARQTKHRHVRSRRGCREAEEGVLGCCSQILPVVARVSIDPWATWESLVFFTFAFAALVRLAYLRHRWTCRRGRIVHDFVLERRPVLWSDRCQSRVHFSQANS